MTSIDIGDNALFCIHFSGSLIQKLMNRVNLNRQGHKFTLNTEEKPCSSGICIYISGFVWLKKHFLAFVQNEFKFTQSDFLYFDHLSISPYLNIQKNNLPSWSPYRMMQVNYLGPVVAFRNLNKDKNSDFYFTQITKEPLNFKAYKPNGLHYLSTKSRNSISEINLNSFGNNSKIISIIIPTRGTKINSKVAILNLVKSINQQNLEGNELEVIVVYDDDNDISYLNSLNSFNQNLNIKLVPYSPPFNFSKKCNLGASSSSGEILIFLNDDTELITQNAIVQMSNLAHQPVVAAVGAKLFFADKSIQHGGVVVIDDNVGHAYFKQINPDAPYGDLKVVHEVSAVTGACLAQRKEVWQESGGWDESFENSYNDVEYCFRLRDLGFTILQNNKVELFHFESLTRDPTFSPEAKKLLLNKWAKYLKDDLFFPEYVYKQKQRKHFRRFAKKFLKKVGFLR